MGDLLGNLKTLMDTEIRSPKKGLLAMKTWVWSWEEVAGILSGKEGVLQVVSTTQTNTQHTLLEKCPAAGCCPALLVVPGACVSFHSIRCTASEWP